MSTTLGQVLAWAAQNWAIFPLAPNSKIPPKGGHGLNDATTDRNLIEQWFRAAPDCNWGVNAGMSDLLILDSDAYKPGASDALNALDLDYGIPATFTVATPNGGTHRYYKGFGSSTVAKLGPGIDTRGAGGYVVLPGSTINGKAYTVLHDAPIADAPEWLVRLAGKPAEKAADCDIAPACELDTPLTIAAATTYAKEAPEAVEGNGGDMTTLRVAMRMKDLGVSRETAFALLAEHYNPRCQPEWDLDELQRKVANAYRYGKSAPGNESFDALPFTPIIVPAVPKRQRWEHGDVGLIAPEDDFDWILGHDMVGGFMTETISPGGVGKSMLTMLECCAITSGRPLTGVPVRKTGRTWIYNTEDPIKSLRLRMQAIGAHYDIPAEVLHDVYISSGQSDSLVIGSASYGKVALNQAVIDEVCGIITDHKIVAWCVDPLVYAHHCDENSNSEMAIIVHVLNDIAAKTGCAINLVHHTSKGGSEGGSMDKSRGASSITGAMRIIRQLQGMSEDDCGSWGVSRDERNEYIGMYDAKMNMAITDATKPRWFRKRSVLLPKGPNVGIVEPVGLQKVQMEDLSDVRDAVIALVQSGCYTDGPEPIADVAVDVKDRDKEGIFGTVATVKRQVREAFEGGALHVPNTDKRIRLLEKGGKCSILVEGGSFDWLG